MKLIEILENRKEALKVAEVAKMLGVTPQHIYKMAKDGLIPCFHVRGAVRFCPSDVAAWIKKEIEASSRARRPPTGGSASGVRFGT